MKIKTAYTTFLVAITLTVGISIGRHSIKYNVTQKECNQQILKAEMNYGASIIQSSFKQDIDCICGEFLHENIRKDCPDMYNQLLKEYKKPRINKDATPPKKMQTQKAKGEILKI